MPDAVAEFHRRGLAAVFAADADLEARAGFAAALDADLDQFADAVLIQNVERIGRQDLLLDIIGDEAADIVAGEAKAHLGQIVGAEGEELGAAGDFAGLQRCARDFDHGAVHVLDRLHLILGADLLVNLVDDHLLIDRALLVADHRNHDFRA